MRRCTAGSLKLLATIDGGARHPASLIGAHGSVARGNRLACICLCMLASNHLQGQSSSELAEEVSVASQLARLPHLKYEAAANNGHLVVADIEPLATGRALSLK